MGKLSDAARGTAAGWSVRRPRSRRRPKRPSRLQAVRAGASGGRIDGSRAASIDLPAPGGVADHQQIVAAGGGDFERALGAFLALDVGKVERILTALAVEATRSANTVISESRCRSVIGETTGRLASEGHIKGRLQPTDVIDTLVGHHALVRREGKSEISFQHQQIQEWYCSFDVGKLMISAAAGDAGAAAKLRVNALNMPAWEEAVLFSCERLSRRDQRGAEAVADSILESLKIDPMLAAEMIYRSAPPVWERIKGTVIEYVDRWHTRGKVDRAVRFMITTGKPEFAPLLWPLIANTDSQVYLAAFRAAERFRPMVLGEDVRGKLSELPDEIREHVIAQFVWESGIDGMELAAEVAKTDTLPQVQFAVVEALQFRSCDRLVKEMLKTAPPAVWSLLAQKGYAHEIRDPEAAARLREEERSIIENDPNPLRRLEYLARSRPKAIR